MKQMNGLPFTHFTFVDFGTPGRRTNYGRHISLPTAIRHKKKIAAYAGLKGSKIWVEDATGVTVA